MDRIHQTTRLEDDVARMVSYFSQPKGYKTVLDFVLVQNHQLYQEAHGILRKNDDFTFFKNPGQKAVYTQIMAAYEGEDDKTLRSYADKFRKSFGRDTEMANAFNQVQDLKSFADRKQLAFYLGAHLRSSSQIQKVTPGEVFIHSHIFPEMGTLSEKRVRYSEQDLIESHTQPLGLLWMLYEGDDKLMHYRFGLSHAYMGKTVENFLIGSFGIRDGQVEDYQYEI